MVRALQLDQGPAFENSPAARDRIAQLETAQSHETQLSRRGHARLPRLFDDDDDDAAAAAAHGDACLEALRLEAADGTARSDDVAAPITPATACASFKIRCIFKIRTHAHSRRPAVRSILRALADGSLAWLREARLERLSVVFSSTRDSSSTRAALEPEKARADGSERYLVFSKAPASREFSLYPQLSGLEQEQEKKKKKTKKTKREDFEEEAAGAVVVTGFFVLKLYTTD